MLSLERRWMNWQESSTSTVQSLNTSFRIIRLAGLKTFSTRASDVQFFGYCPRTLDMTSSRPQRAAYSPSAQADRSRCRTIVALRSSAMFSIPGSHNRAVAGQQTASRPRFQNGLTTRNKQRHGAQHQHTHSARGWNCGNYGSECPLQMDRLPTTRTSSGSQRTLLRFWPWWSQVSSG
jgi:hypothetical protein